MNDVGKWKAVDAARVVAMIESNAKRITSEMIERGAAALERGWPDRFPPGSGLAESEAVLRAAYDDSVSDDKL